MFCDDYWAILVTQCWLGFYNVQFKSFYEEYSVTPDFIICLEDGKNLKMLKRHIKTKYGLSPDQYRERWNLPEDYPMVAPNYTVKRSQLAKQIGLGNRGASS